METQPNHSSAGKLAKLDELVADDFEPLLEQVFTVQISVQPAPEQLTASFQLVDVTRHPARTQPGMREQFSLLFVSESALPNAIVQLSHADLGSGHVYLERITPPPENPTGGNYYECIFS